MEKAIEKGELQVEGAKLVRLTNEDFAEPMFIWIVHPSRTLCKGCKVITREIPAAGGLELLAQGTRLAY